MVTDPRVACGVQKVMEDRNEGWCVCVCVIWYGGGEIPEREDNIRSP
jgi:hypothetical protein